MHGELVTTVASMLGTTSIIEVSGGAGPTVDGRPSLGARPTADLIVWQEVSSGRANGSSPDEVIGELLDGARRALIISLDSPLVPASSSSDASAAVPEPLVDVVARLDPHSEVYPVGAAGRATTVLVLKAPPKRRRRDFGPDTLRALIERHRDPLLLARLRLCAWQTVGFYPDHAPRLWEYPAVAGYLAGAVPAPARVLDIGAGVNPLVPYLSSQGYEVETLDPSPDVRQWPPSAEWNEWGFLDYGEAGLARRSWNCTVDRLPLDRPFDAVFSVSVIEHLGARVRRALLEDTARRVRPGGVVIFTVDLRRGTSRLWNRSAGTPVESERRHGTLWDLVEEADDAGFDLDVLEIVRGWGRVRVDIGFLALRRRESLPAAQSALIDRLTASARRLVRRRVGRG